MGKIIEESIMEKNAKVIEVYDSFVHKLGMDYKDVYVDTNFGKTHILETGNMDREPLIFVHGGNTLNPANLLMCKYLFKDFHIFSVDLIGHSGKSSLNDLSVKNYDYGKWLGEVIDRLHFDRISCFGMSYGAGVIVKLMCINPVKIKKSCLIVPSGIKNGAVLRGIKAYYPFMFYLITKNDKWIEKMFEPLYVKDTPSKEMIHVCKTCIKYGPFKKGIPANVGKELLNNCEVETLIMAAQKDCFFPSKQLLPYAKKNLKNVITIELKDRGHMDSLTKEEENIIIEFLKN